VGFRCQRRKYLTPSGPMIRSMPVPQARRNDSINAGVV
jgi:hypothetical protein